MIFDIFILHQMIKLNLNLIIAIFDFLILKFIFKAIKL
jgi:hypothetical protein